MRLTTDQVNALIDTYMEKRKKERAGKDAEAKLTEKVNRIYTELTSLSKETKNYLCKDCGMEISKRAIRRDFKEYEDLDDDFYTEREKLRNRILVASIDTANIVELEKKLDINF
jgi:hypothetical protein